MTTWTGTLGSEPGGAVVRSSVIGTWHDALAALTDPWTAFTPTWTASTTNPTLSNGTIQAFYQQIGKLVNFRITITFGSTTNAGSGAYTFGLPVTSIEETGVPVGSCVVLDASSPPNRIAAVTAWQNTFTTFGVTGSTAVRMASNSTGRTAADITWATGDQIQVKGTYEAA